MTMMPTLVLLQQLLLARTPKKQQGSEASAPPFFRWCDLLLEAKGRIHQSAATYSAVCTAAPQQRTAAAANILSCICTPSSSQATSTINGTANEFSNEWNRRHFGGLLEGASHHGLGGMIMSIPVAQLVVSWISRQAAAERYGVPTASQRLELDDVGISKLVKTLPSVLGLSVDDNLEPKIAWL
jgi:hypothetical protein